MQGESSARHASATRSTTARRALALLLTAMMLTSALPTFAAPGETRSTLDGVIDSGEYSDSYSIEDGVFEVAWNIVDDNITLALRAHTTGWLALGLNPSDGMLDADMLFGYVDSGGTEHVADEWSTGPTGPHSVDTDPSFRGTDDILEWNGTEEGGVTTIELIRNLTSSDPRDKPFPTNGTLSSIWALGGTDDWESKHTRMDYSTIDVGTGESE